MLAKLAPSSGAWGLSWGELCGKLRRDRKLHSQFFQEPPAAKQSCIQAVKHCIRLSEKAELLTAGSFRELHGCSAEESGLQQTSLKDIMGCDQSNRDRRHSDPKIALMFGGMF